MRGAKIFDIMRYREQPNHGDRVMSKLNATKTTQPLQKEGEVAEYLNVQVATLRRWRWSGEGPRFIKLGGAVRYDPTDVQAFIDAQRRESTSDQSAAAQ